MKIDLHGSLTLADFERLLTKQWAPSFRSRAILFDLTSLQSIGFFSATLLTSWCAELVEKGIQVRVRASAPLPDDAQVFTKGGVFRSMQKLGVAVDSSESSSDAFGLALDVLTVRPTQTLLDDAADAVRRASTDFPEESVRDFCSGALFELLENASIHGRKGAHFGIQIFGGGAVDPFFPSSIQAERYLEIAVGDIGDGIQTLLSEFVPTDYASPFPTTNTLTRDELTLSYAFEFSSTSDADARRMRLHQYLVQKDLPADRVATGLSCVLNVVRTWQGQLIVRTSTALLSINYSRGRLSPLRTAVHLLGTGKDARQGKSLLARMAPLVGTHLLLRFPARRVLNEAGYSHGLPGSKLQENTDVIAPFPEQSDLTETERVIRAIDATDRHVRERRNGLGLTIVRSSRVPLTSRAKALFGAALVAIHRGERHLLCLDRYYTEPAIGIAETYSPPAATDIGVILESDGLATAEVRNVRVASLDVPGYLAGTTEDGRLRINEQILNTFRHEYAKHIRSDLKREFNAPRVRLTNGPFLIEGQYFTNVFFAVASALDDPYLKDLVVQWAASNVPRDTEAIIVGTAAIERILPQLRAHLATLGIEVEIILPEGGRERRAPEKRAVALTDVIARGNVLDAVLQSAQPVFVSAVLSLVDGRDVNEPEDTLSFPAAGTTRHATLWSIVREHIPTYSTVGEARLARRLEEAETRGVSQYSMYFPPQVQVIDPDTHRPTIYLRAMPPIDAAGSAEELLLAAQRSCALLVRHVVHQQRHYAVFVDFVKLFRELRSPIVRWINKTVSEAGPASRRYIVANVDGSLDWIERELREADPSAVIRIVNWNDLRAPDPVATGVREGLTVAIIPGSAGGETARRAIEFASRGNPKDILLLVVMARMEPSHLAFLQSMPRYGEASLRVECFGHLPIRAYSDALTCPLCAASAEIDHVRGAMAPSRLRDVLEEKIARMQAVEVVAGSFNAVEDDVTRARLRAWYEAAEYDLDVRQKLTMELDRSTAAIDLFLEVVAAETKSRHFSVPLLRRRLLQTFGRVMARVNEILWTAEPPFALAPKIPAILHLVGAEFVIPTQRLLRAYARSKMDFEEICVALAVLPAAPAGAEALLSDMNADPGGEIDTALLAATIVAVQGPPDDEAERFVADFDMLRQCMVNSSLVTVRLPDLIEAVQSPNSMGIGEAAMFVYDGWTVEVATLLARLMSSWRWRALAARHSAMQEKVVALARRMNAVHQLAYKLDWLDADRRHALTVSSQVERDLNEAIGEICKLRVAPTRIPALHQKSIIPTMDGRVIRVSGTIDPNVPFVFGHMQTLQDVIEEIVENWTLHNEGKDGHGAISVRAEGDFVVIEISDDLEKPIRHRENVKGGVSMFEDYCRDYCARAEVREAKIDGLKSVALYLRALPEEKKEPKWMTARRN